MRIFITKAKRKEIIKTCKTDTDCCLVKLNGKSIHTLDDYYKKLKKKLQLNDSFSNNLNAYKDMMCDPYTYGNKSRMVIIVKHYKDFLKKDPKKKQVEAIFDEAIIPFFNEANHAMDFDKPYEMQVYCVE